MRTGGAGGLVAIYTDGSCLGNAQAAETECPAGWAAVAVFEPGSQVLAELFGPVVTPHRLRADPGLASFNSGAERGTNNTAELTGVLEGLRWARDYVAAQLQADDDAAGGLVFKGVEIRYDSEYAAGVVSGERRAGKNLALVQAAQRELEALEAALKEPQGCPPRPRPSGNQDRHLPTQGAGAVGFRHVRAHRGDVFNERADELAKRGAKGEVGLAGRWKAYRPSSLRPLASPAARSPAARSPAARSPAARSPAAGQEPAQEVEAEARDSSGDGGWASPSVAEAEAPAAGTPPAVNGVVPYVSMVPQGGLPDRGWLRVVSAKGAKVRALSDMPLGPGVGSSGVVGGGVGSSDELGTLPPGSVARFDASAVCPPPLGHEHMLVAVGRLRCLLDDGLRSGWVSLTGRNLGRADPITEILAPRMCSHCDRDLTPLLPAEQEAHLLACGGNRPAAFPPFRPAAQAEEQAEEGTPAWALRRDDAAPEAEAAAFAAAEAKQRAERAAARAPEALAAQEAKWRNRSRERDRAGGQKSFHAGGGGGGGNAGGNAGSNAGAPATSAPHPSRSPPNSLGIPGGGAPLAFCQPARPPVSVSATRPAPAPGAREPATRQPRAHTPAAPNSSAYSFAPAAPTQPPTQPGQLPPRGAAALLARPAAGGGADPVQEAREARKRVAHEKQMEFRRKRGLEKAASQSAPAAGALSGALKGASAHAAGSVPLPSALPARPGGRPTGRSAVSSLAAQGQFVKYGPSCPGCAQGFEGLGLLGVAAQDAHVGSCLIGDL